MSKLLLLLLLGFAAYLIFKGIGRRAAARHDARASQQPPLPENMVACARCGVHLPESEAVTVAGRHYCCEAHRDARP